MNDILQLIRLKLRLWWANQNRQISKYFKQNRWKIVGLIAMVYLANKQNMNFQMPSFASFGFENKQETKRDNASLIDMSSVISFIKGERNTAHPVAQKVSQKATKSWKDDANNSNLGNTYSNVSFWGGKNDAVNKRSKKRDIQKAYIARFAKIAQAETDKFGIPASIILAQGILESNAGGSSLAMNNNNHFGIKCFSRSCKKGHCSNFTDDSHKDFFKIYGSPWQSFRDHSFLLKRFHYRKLFRLHKNDYKGWANGLQNLGYATDKHYAESLIRTIEDLELDKFD